VSWRVSAKPFNTPDCSTTGIIMKTSRKVIIEERQCNNIVVIDPYHHAK